MTQRENMARREKAFSDPIYLLGIQPVEDINCRKFNILGATGNEYLVTISNHFSCTCPDFTRRKNLCKHLFFVFLRVCKTTIPNPSELTDDRLQTIFANMPEFLEQNLLYSEDNLAGSASASATEEKGYVMQKIDDCCPICLEELSVEDLPSLTFCKFGCGKSVHVQCFNQYTRFTKIIRCMFCRESMVKKRKRV
jgi:E3 ubiquitin-protein ligase ZSWIM2